MHVLQIFREAIFTIRAIPVKHMYGGEEGTFNFDHPHTEQISFRFDHLEKQIFKKTPHYRSKFYMDRSQFSLDIVIFHSTELRYFVIGAITILNDDHIYK